MRKVAYGVNLKKDLNYLKFLEMVDMIEKIDIAKFLNKTQRKIIERIKKDGYVSQKQLLSELKIPERTLIENVKKLEEGGLVFTRRSSTKFIYLNPGIYYFQDFLKLTREHFLLNERLYKKIEEMNKEAQTLKTS